jgi:hypothetical protein
MEYVRPSTVMEPPVSAPEKWMQKMNGNVLTSPQSRFLMTSVSPVCAVVNWSDVAVPPSMVRTQPAVRLKVDEPKATLVSVPGQPV